VPVWWTHQLLTRGYPQLHSWALPAFLSAVVNRRRVAYAIRVLVPGISDDILLNLAYSSNRLPQFPRQYSMNCDLIDLRSVTAAGNEIEKVSNGRITLRSWIHVSYLRQNIPKPPILT
jgi:hypothetical protein